MKSSKSAKKKSPAPSFSARRTIVSSSKARALPGSRRCSRKRLTSMKNDTVCTVLCGGNIDANLLSRVLEQVLVRQGRYIMLKLLVDRPTRNARQLLNHTAGPAQTSSKSFTAARCGSRRSAKPASKCCSKSATNSTDAKSSHISKNPATTSNAKASAIGKSKV